MKKFATLLFSIAAFIFSIQVFAISKPPAGISLYEKPDEKSKVIGTIPPGAALVPIISQKNWTKVGDTKTGNVGWVNNATLHQYGVGKIRTITKSVNTPQGQSYQVIQFGSQQLDQTQVNELMNNWKTTQENFGRSFNQMMNQSLYNLNQFLQDFNREQAKHPLMPQPVVQPIILVPSNPQAPAASSTMVPPQNSVIAPTPMPPSSP